MHAVVDLLYNATLDVPCYNVSSLQGPAGPGLTWLYQWCTERMGQELPYFPANGRTDMFWDQGLTLLMAVLRLLLHKAHDGILSLCPGLERWP